MQPPQWQGSLNVQVVQRSPHLESIIAVASFCMVKLEFVANYYFYESKNFSANHTSFNLSTKFKSILFVHR